MRSPDLFYFFIFVSETFTLESPWKVYVFSNLTSLLGFAIRCLYYFTHLKFQGKIKFPGRSSTSTTSRRRKSMITSRMKRRATPPPAKLMCPAVARLKMLGTCPSWRTTSTILMRTTGSNMKRKGVTMQLLLLLTIWDHLSATKTYSSIKNILSLPHNWKQFQEPISISTNGTKDD